MRFLIILLLLTVFNLQFINVAFANTKIKKIGEIKLLPNSPGDPNEYDVIADIAVDSKNGKLFALIQHFILTDSPLGSVGLRFLIVDISSGTVNNSLDLEEFTESSLIPRAVGRLAVNSKAGKIYVSTGTDKVIVIDESNGNILKKIVTGDGTYGIVVNPATSKVYVSNTLSKTILIIDSLTDELISTIDIHSGPGPIAVNSKRNKIYVISHISAAIGGFGTGIAVVDGSQNKVIDEISFPANAELSELAVDSSKDIVYTTDFKNGIIYSIKGLKKSRFANLGKDFSLQCDLILNPEMKKLYVSQPFITDEKLLIFNTKSKKIIQKLSFFSNDCELAEDSKRGLVFLSDGYSVFILGSP